jgi:steroid 5-alpha reductase family enzyme
MSNSYCCLLASGNEMELVGFTIEMYCDAQSYERQILILLCVNISQSKLQLCLTGCFMVTRH